MPLASQLQFSVNNLSFQAKSSDTVQSVLERIYRNYKIPIVGKGLIYKEKQLQGERTLAECAIRNDAELQLVRQMRSPAYLQAWRIIDDMISLARRLCEGETVPYALKTIKTKISEYLSMTPKDDANPATTHLRIFMVLSAPKALLKLYMSPIRGNKEHAVNSIKHFLESCITELPKSLLSHCAPIVLRFCEYLRRIAPHDPLYLTCRSSLGSMMEVIKVQWVSGRTKSVKRAISIKEIFPFVKELAYKLSRDMEASLISTASMGSWRDVEDFSMFLRPLRTVMSGYKGFDHPISLPMENEHRDVLSCKEEVELLYQIFEDMLKKMDKCLSRMQQCSSANVSGEIDIAYPARSRYLTILKELNAISKLYLGSEEQFWTNLSMRKCALCMLVVRYAKRNDDHKWLLEHKDIMDFESRRHLVMMMFPEVKEDFEDRLEMLIDRSQLLSQSLECIANAEAESLHGSIFIKYEEATGPGVMRQWVLLVCQAIFNQKNHLFVACPSDHRRFYPNPASKVDYKCLKKFNFYGRMIGLALMHKVQVGIVLDRVFFLQLGGYSISLEDIRDANPDMYNRWKQILEMDAESIDSSPLRLPFIEEIEELRLRRDLELCDDGLNMLVNSKNRNDYVDLLIKHQFVTSISQQVSHFAQGFGDILSNLRLQKFFFQSLELEDIDQMLHGGENDISVEDWKAHTEYNGYKSSDDQIDWFWKIVSEMSPQQKRNILFYWTSVKYLPVEGFRGLGSRLSIYKSMEDMDHLPSAHTCVYHLCFPPYPNMTIMQQRLSFIAQEYVACSFGIQ